jgi:hypothetical protein
MASGPPADVALSTLRTDSARWSDEAPEEIETAIGDMIRDYARQRPLRGVVLRMHPAAWREIKTWVRNVCSRWPATCAVKIVCNPDQDPRAIALSGRRLETDTRCQLGRSSGRKVVPLAQDDAEREADTPRH